MGDSFKLKTFENVGYNAFGKVIALLFQLAANVVLARNLSSSDYGVAGFAMIFTAFLTQFGDMGIQAAVIRERELDDRGMYTGFTVKAALGALVFAAAFLLAPLAGLLFDNAAVVGVVRLLSVNFLINSFSFLPVVRLTRDLDYRRLFVPQTVSVAVNSAVSILLARSGYGYWSIVLGNVAATAVFAAAVALARPVKVRFLYDGERADGFIRFGGSLFFSGLLAFLIFNVDNFVIGSLNGASELGYYAVAFNWGSMICGILGAVVLNVLFPTFSRFQGDRARLKKAYLRVLEYVGFFGVLCNFGLFSVSREFLFLALGRGSEKWLPSLAALKILCVYGVIRLLLEPVGSVVLAIGRSGALLRVQLLMAALELALLYPALRYFGIEGVAAAVTVSYAAAFAAVYPLLKRELDLGLREWAAPAAPALLSAVPAAVLVFAARKFLPVSLPGLAAEILLFTAVYCSWYGLMTKWKMAGEIIAMAKEFSGRTA